MQSPRKPQRVCWPQRQSESIALIREPFSHDCAPAAVIVGQQKHPEADGKVVYVPRGAVANCREVIPSESCALALGEPSWTDLGRDEKVVAVA